MCSEMKISDIPDANEHELNDVETDDFVDQMCSNDTDTPRCGMNVTLSRRCALRHNFKYTTNNRLASVGRSR